MEPNIENKDPQEHEMWQKWEREHTRSKILGGIIIVAIGTLFLVHELGVAIPDWVYTWKTLLITLGLLIGIKSGFKNGIWFVLMAIGGIYLAADFYPQLILKQLLWPIMVILLGLFILIKPRKKYKSHNWEKWCRMQQKRHYRYARRHGRRHPHHTPHFSHFDSDFYKADAEATKEDSIELVSFMSGARKNITTKNFKGGDITVVFAGAKINMSQADFNEKAVLEMTAVFGGAQLIIPAHWEIKSEMVCVFGNVEDKREIKPVTGEPTKVLVLRGTIFMGGMEIKSF